MTKKRTKKYRPKPASGIIASKATAAQRFQIAIAKHDMTMATEQDADEMTVSPLMNIERLATGTLNNDGFIDLNEANIAGFCIAGRIHRHANAASKAIILQAEPIFITAANALAEIGTRKIKRGKYIATGDELQAIRDSMQTYRQVILIAEKGHVMTGLIRAKELVDQKLQLVWSENERKAA